jgi:hypothetical protein
MDSDHLVDWSPPESPLYAVQDLRCSELPAVLGSERLFHRGDVGVRCRNLSRTLVDSSAGIYPPSHVTDPNFYRRVAEQTFRLPSLVASREGVAPLRTGDPHRCGDGCPVPLERCQRDVPRLIQIAEAVRVGGHIRTLPTGGSIRGRSTAVPSGDAVRHVSNPQTTPLRPLMPPGARTVLSVGASGSWYLDWFAEAYGDVERHIA